MSKAPKNARSSYTLDEGSAGTPTASDAPIRSGSWPDVAVPVATLDNDALLTALNEVVGHERCSLGRILVLLIEVEERRLHAESATPSMFDFCVQKLGYSESEAYRRISVARLGKAFPEVLDALVAGRVSLTNASLVAKVITPENVTRVLEDISGKTRRQVEAYVVRHRPKPDLPDSIRKLSASKMAAPSTNLDLPDTQGSTGGDESTSAEETGEPVVVAIGGRIEPLSSDRFGIRFTIDTATCAKLDRAIALLSHQNPNRNYAVVLDRALDALLAQLERQRFAATDRPRKATPPKDEATIPADTKRRVVERDGERCAWVDKNGERCSATDFLEFDHIDPRAKGGCGRDPSGVRLLCRAHNRHAADTAYGREFVEERIRATRAGRAARRSVHPATESATGRSAAQPTSVAEASELPASLKVDSRTTGEHPTAPNNDERSTTTAGSESSPHELSDGEPAAGKADCASCLQVARCDETAGPIVEE